ncbi:hypothetical protein BJ742DRAFT_742299 [Cladochytrium replicatum]|nr:hypothetical protein BJ742DRAFT_742299 [Cladochytrium replicatum]
MGIPIRRANDAEPEAPPPQNGAAQNSITLDLQLSRGPAIPSSSLRTTTSWSPLLGQLNQPAGRRTSTRSHRSHRNFEHTNEQRRRLVIENGEATGANLDERPVRALRRNQPNQNPLWDRIRTALQTAAHAALDAQDSIDCPFTTVPPQELTVSAISAWRAASSPTARRRRLQPPPPPPPNATRWQRYQRQMDLIQQGIVLPLSQRWDPPRPDEVPYWWDMSLEHFPPAADEPQPTTAAEAVTTQREATAPEFNGGSGIPTSENSNDQKDGDDHVSESEESDISDTDSQVLSSLWMIELFSSTSDGCTSFNHQVVLDNRNFNTIAYIQLYLRMKDLRRRLRQLRSRYDGLPRRPPPRLGRTQPYAPSDINDDEGASRRRRRNGDFDAEDEHHRNLRQRDRERSWAERWNRSSTRAWDLGELGPFEGALARDQDTDAWERASRRRLRIIHDGRGTPPGGRAEMSNWDDLTVGVGNNAEPSENATQPTQQLAARNTAARSTQRVRSLSDWSRGSGEGWESSHHPQHNPESAPQTIRPIRRSDNWADNAWSGWSGGWNTPSPAQWDNAGQSNPPPVRRTQVPHAWRAGVDTNAREAGRVLAPGGQLSVSDDDVAAAYTRTDVTTSNDDADDVSGWTDWGVPTTAQRGWTGWDDDEVESSAVDGNSGANGSESDDDSTGIADFRTFVQRARLWPQRVDRPLSPPFAWEVAHGASTIDQPQVVEQENTDDWLAPSTPSVDWEFLPSEHTAIPLAWEISQEGRVSEGNDLPPQQSLQQEGAGDRLSPLPEFDWEVALLRSTFEKSQLRHAFQGTNEISGNGGNSDDESLAANDELVEFAQPPGSSYTSQTFIQNTDEYLRHRDHDPALEQAQCLSAS